MPPRFCPPLKSLPIKVRSEAIIAKLLEEQLNSDWTVFHSYPWLTNHSGRIDQGETDFILLHPCGLIVLEVKGGSITYDCDTREWSQNHHIMKDPFDQARRGMHLLLSKIGESDFVRGYCVAFPNCRFHGSLPPGVMRPILFDADDLTNINNKLHKLLKEWGEGRPVPSKHEAVRIQKVLLPRCQLIPDLRHILAAEEEILHCLTQTQLDTLSGIFTMDRVLIRGVAGSGKTLLALQRALDLSQQNLRTLFLCYNKNLAQDLRATYGREYLEFMTFHEACHQFCLQSGIPFQVESSEDWWENIPPELLLQALELRPDLRYDALLVDEGQDFRATWWIAALALLKDETAPCYVFYDPQQNIYKTRLELPDFACKFVLQQNCRNTSQIARSCQLLQAGDCNWKTQAPEGRPPTIEVVEEVQTATRAISQNLQQILNYLKPQDIAVLSPYSRSKSACSEIDGLTSDLRAWRQGEAPLFSTIRSFKGLEASVVILVDLPVFDEKAATKTDVFVAMTRAKTELRIITSNPTLPELLGLGMRQS